MVWEGEGGRRSGVGGRGGEGGGRSAAQREKGRLAGRLVGIEQRGRGEGFPGGGRDEGGESDGEAGVFAGMDAVTKCGLQYIYCQ